ncbi:ABA-responsive protein ABR18 [Spatholobus suberectus]|nr:ABA-responsive protein ABR18 [Spatholobus suberectus]
MDVGVYTQEYDTPTVVPPTRLFKAMTLDFHNLFLKLVDGIHSIVFIEGSGGPGTIKKITTIEGGRLGYWLNREQRTYVSVTGFDLLVEQVNRIRKRQGMQKRVVSHYATVIGSD